MVATGALLLVPIVAAATQRGVDAAMAPVRVIQARIQGDEPRWEPEQGTFVSAYGSTFAERYRAVFDSVNTASVEGALMYVQAEGINVQHNSECKRKNNMQYVVFYELRVLQPEAALAAYDSDASTVPEYSPFVAMDGGACTKAGTELPQECTALFAGASNSTKVGPAVGASVRDTDPRAPYPDTIWFSFPNSCVMTAWSAKTPECRSQYPGGLCAYGSEPDGKVCSFTYKTLGYLKLDDLVGITQLTSSRTGQPYANYTEFCQDTAGQFGGVEFSAASDNAAGSVTAIPFWEQPFDKDACRARTTAMVALYNNFTATASRHMTTLPTPAALSAANPPCYQNSQRCATAAFGCKRELYSQICRVCTQEEDGCVKASYSLS